MQPGMESSGPKNLGAMMIGGGDDEEEGADDKKPDKGELSRVALLHADATEAEGDLVITDAALDLALIRIRGAEDKDPVVPAAPTAAKAAPALLDNVIAIERKGADFQRIASASLLQIAALVTTPRNLYVCAAPLEGGTAVYNMAGELLGVSAVIHNESVIVPSEAILKLAAKVPAKADK